ncbi:family 16 glycosylhydrolase [Roseibacillus persicicus]|uniref:family 16 glycosylhydrolase n=1 Tax=Roseibacillus persicicus TaxID=454148 RepID=UPI00398B7AF3
MKALPLQLFALLASGLCAIAQELPGWELVWADEFTQADGTSPDATKWNFNLGRGSNGWGNAELQYYTDRTENARIENNQLMIEVREENNYANSGANYTSARLLTQNKHTWQYGRMEARIKVPDGQGLWPAFWTLGADITSVGWPSCGEIDIMEFVGRLPDEIFGTIHGPGYAGGDSFESIYEFGGPVSSDYHTYAIEWEENLIRWYVDGIHYHTATPADVAPNSWAFNHDFFILLNVAVGGNFGGPVGSAVSFPKQMLVDYVRVYAPAGGGNRLANPGFETGSLSSWVPYDGAGANDPGAFVESTNSTYYNGGNGGDHVLTRSGTYVAKVFGDFIGAENFNGIYQDVAANPDSLWNARGFALTHPQDLMSGTNTAWLEVSFRDDSDAVLSLHRSEIQTSTNVTPGTWMELEVNKTLDPNTFEETETASELTAPEGTTKVRFQVVYRQDEGYDGGSMYFDDLSLNEIVVEPLDPNLEMGTIVSWVPENSSSSYQLQASEDGTSWSNVGEAIEGVELSASFSPSLSAFYRVVETTASSSGNGVLNPSFESIEPAQYPSPGAVDWRIASSEELDPGNGFSSMTVESIYDAFTPRTGDRMLVVESSTPTSGPVVAPSSDVRSALIPVDANTVYDITFYAAHVVKAGGANPQLIVRFYNADSGYIGDSGYKSFASIDSSWTEVTSRFTTPAGTAFAEVSWIQALGAGNNFHWVTLIDDVELLTDSLPGTENILSASQERGYQISWNTTLGRSYQITSSNELLSFPTVEATLSGDGSLMGHFGPAPEESRFFRVEELAP